MLGSLPVFNRAGAKGGALSVHIEAESGEIAETVLLPGDPLRAQYVADNYLERSACYNRIRGMLGFTGYFQGQKISVQGTGMGVPSISIYAHELVSEYGAKRLIRIGTCGALQPDLNLGDVVLAQAACTDSSINRIRFNNNDYAPIATFALLKQAHEAATQKGLKVQVGLALTSDTFYSDDPDSWRLWARYGVLVVEMETAALYTLAARHRVQALSVLTVSDSLVTGKQASAEQRQRGYADMMELAVQIGGAPL
jgi:purine-nucleoside phosphorylase